LVDTKIWHTEYLQRGGVVLYSVWWRHCTFLSPSVKAQKQCTVPISEWQCDVCGAGIFRVSDPLRATDIAYFCHRARRVRNITVASTGMPRVREFPLGFPWVWV